jgi:dolichol-phosphate mannosyltransferase
VNLISVIVPFLNEEDCIEAFCGHIETVAQNKPYEIEVIFVDDGSTDSTVKKIQEFKFEHCKHIKAVSLSKNFGSHAAIRAGLQNADGDYFVFICADLQEPDDMVDVMYNNIVNGLDVVKVEKITVKQDFIGRAFGLVTSALIRKYAVKDYGSGGISNIMFNKKVLLFLNENIESNTSIVLQIIDAGFKSVTVGMNYNSRSAGVSKWTFSKRIKLFIDSFVSFSFMPIRLVSLVGILMFVIGVTLGIITVINRLINPDFVAGFATISSILLFGFGITNISLGIIAEYLWRTYDSSRRRPVFIVSEIKNIK